MKIIWQACAAMLLAICAVSAHAGIVVIVHPSVAVGALTVEQVGQLFTGRVKSLPDGTRVTPVDLVEGLPLRVRFVERVLGKSEQQLRSYWSRMIFTGKGQPPRSVDSAADVVRLVSSSTGFIGYVDIKDVGAGKVKVLYSLE